jgi:hypothetical protein
MLLEYNGIYSGESQPTFRRNLPPRHARNQLQVGSKQNYACCFLYADFQFIVLFNPEDGSDMFPRKTMVPFLPDCVSSYPRGHNYSAVSLSAVMNLDFKNAYKMLVLTVLWLREGGVAQRWRLHEPTFLLLHVHVIVGVFHQSSRSRRDLGR